MEGERGAADEEAHRVGALGGEGVHEAHEAGDLFLAHEIVILDVPSAAHLPRGAEEHRVHEGRPHFKLKNVVKVASVHSRE